jgi:hypothetical protein
MELTRNNDLGQQIVWNSQLDQIYDVSVVRINRDRGTLYVKLGDTILYEKEVGLSYDAIFGADMFDIQSWMYTGIEVVDNLPNKSTADQ